MKKFALRHGALIGTLLCAWAGASASWIPAPENSLPDYAAMREARAQSLTQPYGWFSLVALQWLKDGDTTVGSAAGSALVLPHAPPHLLTVHKAAGKVTLTQVVPGVQMAGAAAHTGEQVGEEEDMAHAITSGSLRLWLIDRGGQKYLRVKDPEAPARTHFHGLRWFAPQAQYRVTAKWVPYPAGHTLAITNKLGQVSQEPAPGYAGFSIGGRQQMLVPTVEDGSLFFVFSDATGHLETDGGGRFLSTPGPSHGLDRPGTVVLDFNEAVNPPCAYSPFATCPLAPRVNRLPVSVPAGEKRYDD